MDIFEKIGKKFGLIKETNKTEEIMKQRSDIKLNLAVKLYQQGFNDDEIEQVLNIIKNAEYDIQIIKNSLNGTNINPDLSKDPNAPLLNGIEKIRKRQLEMQKELNESIQKIMQTKKG